MPLLMKEKMKTENVGQSSQEMKKILDIIDLEKWFGGLAAVNNLSFSVKENEIFGIFGPNGAGKTTTLNLICGFLSPDKGRIFFRDESIEGKKPYSISGLGIARTYQNIRLFDGLSVLETIETGFYHQRRSTMLDAIFLTKKDRNERATFKSQARELMTKVGLSVHPEMIANNLSYGDQRRVEIARALAVNPKLLLLDEPTAGMNAVETELLGELFLKLRDEGITLIIIEHNMKMILNYCERAIVMNFGQLLATGTPQDCVSNVVVQEAYFGKATDAKRLESIIGLRKY